MQPVQVDSVVDAGEVQSLELWRRGCPGHDRRVVGADVGAVRERAAEPDGPAAMASKRGLREEDAADRPVNRVLEQRYNGTHVGNLKPGARRQPEPYPREASFGDVEILTK